MDIHREVFKNIDPVAYETQLKTAYDTYDRLILVFDFRNQPFSLDDLTQFRPIMNKYKPITYKKVVRGEIIIKHTYQKWILKLFIKIINLKVPCEIIKNKN